ncbi:MAG TPA: DUF4388 domain-containing protein [Deltaproteobacteria bacterium]|nr:DUF4388 domain-containing protein [Deltaproteobacteria bacterium]
MALKGDIKTIPVPDIFQWLGNNKKTGILIFTKKKIQKNFFFEDGCIVFASSNKPMERLGEFLVNMHALSRPIVVEALKKARKKGITFIEYLIKNDLIEQSDLETIIAKLTTYIFTSLLAWKHGSFLFLDEAYTKEPVKIKLSLDVISLVLNGSRELDETLDTRNLEDSIEIDMPFSDVVILDEEDYLSSSSSFEGFGGWEKGEIVCPRCRKVISLAVQNKHFSIEHLRKHYTQ